MPIIRGSQLTTGHVVNGIQHTSGDVVHIGRHQITGFDGEIAICKYLHNGATTRFIPMPDDNYSVDEVKGAGV